MRKQQILLLSAGLILILVIYFFGNTIPPKDKSAMSASPMTAKAPALSTTDVIAAATAKLPAAIKNRITNDINTAEKSTDNTIKIAKYNALSTFWGDSVHNMPLSMYYKGIASKLDNSEKDITFAARKLVSYIMVEQSQPMQTWMATEAKDLFEAAIKINPSNDTAKVGLGACYMFGNLSNSPMQEILKVRAVADKNPDNMYAQMILGMGDVKTGQYEKAVKRFSTVVKNQPQNLEAIFNLADVYDRLQDNSNAIKWYEVAKKMIQVPEAKNEIAQRILELKSK